MKRERAESLEKEEQAEDKAMKPAPLKAVKTNFTEKDIKGEKKLTREYFRQDVVELSKNLLGKVMIRETPEGVMRAIIVETEAYKAPLDKACHAYNSISSVIETRRPRRPSTSG